MHYRIKSVLALLIIILSIGFCSQTVNAAEQNKVYTADHIKDEEARQVYQRVLDATSFMLEDSENSKECLYVYGTDEIRDMICDDYISVANISKESFYAMSSYELCLEFVTYGRIQSKFLKADNASRIFTTEEKLVSWLLSGESDAPGLIIRWYKEGTNKEPMEALIELYRYQYKYLQEHGCFYDFFRGADYLELQGMVQENEEISKEELSVEIKQEVQENEDIEFEEVKTEVSEEKVNPLAPKNVFSDLIKDHIVSIIIIAILVALLAYITIKNKRTNKKDVD